MTFGELFAGIGGFSLGLERAGMTCKWQVEIDPYATAVLKKHWPEVPKHDDVRTFPPEGEWGVDLICGGFPCQDISVAGKGAGLAGARSGLWYEFARIIRAVGPRWVVIENVPALTSRGLGTVLGDLAEIGMDAEWHCIPACAVGAPHRRDRIWIVALRHADGERSDLQCQPDSANGRTISQEARRQSSRVSCESDVADAKGVSCRAGLCQGKPQQDGNQSGDGGCDVPDADRAGRQQQRWPESVRAEQFAAQCGGWWKSEPDVGRVAHGVPSELDFIRGVIGHEGDYQKAKPEAQELVWRIMRQVWQQQQLAASSPNVYRERLRDLVPSVSHERAHQGWLLGKRIKEDQELCDLWGRVCSAPFNEAQDLLADLLERIGKTKRPKEVGGRVDRLRCLGNAVVPQVVEIIGRAIIEAERRGKTQ